MVISPSIIFWQREREFRILDNEEDRDEWSAYILSRVEERKEGEGVNGGWVTVTGVRLKSIEWYVH